MDQDRARALLTAERAEVQDLLGGAVAAGAEVRETEDEAATGD